MGPVHLVATGRDLLTGVDGSAETIGTARLEADIDYLNDRTVTAIAADPPVPGIDALVGRPTVRGFRRAVREALPDATLQPSVLHQLLDDMPTALLVAGYTMSAAGALTHHKPEQSRIQVADLCAGWVEEGTIMVALRSGEQVPVVTGPEAPAVADPQDPIGWHGLGSLGPHDMRRLRRIDVWVDGDEIVVDAFFRDSHMSPEGLETVVHEYGLAATLDAGTGVFTSCRGTIGALPWVECPGALASAGRIVGLPAAELRGVVGKEFTGPSTCTHLNDTLRALEDVPALAGALA